MRQETRVFIFEPVHPFHICSTYTLSSPRSIEKSNSTIQSYQRSRATTPNGFSISKNLSTVANQDIVRIYVPPADDMIAGHMFQRERGEDEISQCSNRSSIIQVEYDVQPMESPSKDDQSLPCVSKVQPQQYYYPNPKQTVPTSSSSSRRGSMTRKTPSPLLNDFIVCDHMKIRRSNDNLNEETPLTFSVKRMTSFEELAKKSDSKSMLYIHEIPADTGQKFLEAGAENIKSHSITRSASKSYNVQRKYKHSSSDNNSPFDYDLLEEKRNESSFTYADARHQENNDNSIKSYDRFFNSDDELEDDEIKQNRATKKFSSIGTHRYTSGTDEDDENSSNSPTNKSILNTPINDTMPLLSCDPDPILNVSQAVPSIHPSSSNSVRQKSKIPIKTNRGSNNNSLRKNSSVSSPDSDKSEGYRSSGYCNDSSMEKQQADNKIRIKISHKN